MLEFPPRLCDDRTWTLLWHIAKSDRVKITQESILTHDMSNNIHSLTQKGVCDEVDADFHAAIRIIPAIWQKQLKWNNFFPTMRYLKAL